MFKGLHFRVLIPDNDDARIEDLHSFKILDTPEDESFDAMTRLTARLFSVNIALVSLVDKDRQWFKSSHGLDADQTSRDQAFCTYAFMEPEPLIVLDATLYNRFNDNPLVTGQLPARDVLYHRHEAAGQFQWVRA